MLPSNKLIEFVKQAEGFRSKAELDTLAKPPVWTIGYGETLNVKNGDVITEPNAANLLESRLEFFGNFVNSLVTRTITQGQYDALTDFCYNEGFDNLKKSTLLKLVNSKQDTLADQEFMRWVYAGGMRLTGLCKRRNVERLWYLT